MKNFFKFKKMTFIKTNDTLLSHIDKVKLIFIGAIMDVYMCHQRGLITNDSYAVFTVLSMNFVDI